MTKPTRHFFCHATDANGDTLDWFVEATSREEALGLWEYAVEAAGLEFDENQPVQVWQLPELTGKPTFINWYDDTPEDGHPFLLPVVGNEPEEPAYEDDDNFEEDHHAFELGPKERAPE